LSGLLDRAGERVAYINGYVNRKSQGNSVRNEGKAAAMSLSGVNRTRIECAASGGRSKPRPYEEKATAKNDKRGRTAGGSPT